MEVALDKLVEGERIPSGLLIKFPLSDFRV